MGVQALAMLRARALDGHDYKQPAVLPMANLRLMDMSLSQRPETMARRPRNRAVPLSDGTRQA
jgi:hypothetical protein